MKKFLNNINIPLFIIILSIILYAFLLLRETRYDFFHRPSVDYYSDVRCLIAAENLKNYGFFSLNGNLYHERGKIDQSYKGYPPLPDWINYLERKLGFSKVQDFRKISCIISIAALLFLVLFIYKVFNINYAAFGAFFFSTQSEFIIYGVSVHHYPYGILFTFLGLFLFVKHIETKKLWILLLSWIALFLNGLSSYEFILFSIIFIFGYSLLKRKSLFPAWILLAAPVCSIIIRFLIINATELGTNQAFLYMIDLAQQRSTGLSITYFITQIPTLIFFFEKKFGYGALFITLIWLIHCLYRWRKKTIDMHLKFMFLLLICSISWLLVMPSHFYVHMSMTVPRHLAVFMSLLFFWLITKLFFAENTSTSKSYIYKILLAVFIIIQLDRITDEYLCLSRQPCFSEEARNIISEINRQGLPVFTNVLETKHEEEWLKMWYKIMLRYYIESPSKLKSIDTINNEDIAPHTYFIIVKKVPGNLFSSCNKNRMAFISYQVRKFIEKMKGAYIYPDLQTVQYLKNKTNILYEDETWLIAQKRNYER